MNQALFITATGTGIGKTLTTAGLAGALCQQSRSVAVYKPIQTGSALFGTLRADGQEELSDLDQIKVWLDNPNLPTANSYEFPEPVAPYAADPRRTIEVSRLHQDFQALQEVHEITLIEGAGGIRVPIAPDYEMLDLMADFDVPILLVGSPFLGGINHILLSVAALQARQLPIAGLVLSGGLKAGQNAKEHPESALRTLEETLLPFLTPPYLGWIPEVSSLQAGVFAFNSSELAPFQHLCKQLFQ